MAELKDKIENALNESRTLVLGATVLVGFQFESVFQTGFAKLPLFAQILRVCALALLLLTLVLLMAPATYHRLVARMQDTENLNRFTSLVTGAALLPFALGLAIDLFLSLDIVAALGVALAGGVTALGVILFLWYGLELVVRMRQTNKKYSKPTQERAATSLSDQIKQVLTEARIVLPGAQALLGFQFVIMLAAGFDSLPAALKYIHIASLAAVALCTVVLMAPAAYHRIVARGEDSESVLNFACWMVVSGMILLALGIGGDFWVVVTRVSGSMELGIVSAVIVLAVFYGMWFGLMFWLRQREPRTAQ